MTELLRAIEVSQGGYRLGWTLLHTKKCEVAVYKKKRAGLLLSGPFLLALIYDRYSPGNLLLR